MAAPRRPGPLPDDVLGSGGGVPPSMPRLHTANSPFPLPNDPSLSSRSMPEADTLRQSGGQDTKRLYVMRQSRKQAEEDLVTMRNRIKRLQLEEHRAQKNIEETRKRADDIVRLKAQNELRARAKEQARIAKERELKREMHVKSIERAQREANIKANRQAAIRTKQQMVVDARREREANIKATKDARREAEERAARIKEEIYARERQAVHTKYRQMHLQQIRVVQRYEERVMEEEQIRSEREAEIQRLEDEEHDLLRRLKQAQELQKSAYTELEIALDV